MNLLNKLTVMNLKLNKKRTAVTIIGIILATALITAVAGMVTSFRATMVEHAREVDGNYHYAYQNVPKDELKYIKNNRNVESYYITQNIGYAKLKDSQNEYKPYVHLMAYDHNALLNSSIKLVEGRMPQNEKEIVIGAHINTNAKLEYKVGDKLTLDIGRRIAEGCELGQDNSFVEGIEETIEKKFTKTYEIVGIIERPNYAIEPYSAPGYSIITYLDNSKIEEKADIYTLYTKKGLNNQYKVTAEILGLDTELFTKMQEGKKLSDSELGQVEQTKYLVKDNKGLLAYESLNLSDSNLGMIYSVGIIVIGIIIVTSVFCIRNSFAISITEKMKQYGMLSSIGATAKQIRKNVFYEAIILSVIAIPLGVASGILAVFVLLKLIEIILGGALDNIRFIFRVPWSAVTLAVILSLITIFLSARKSAKRASKVSPIEAIRSNEDIKIKSKKIKSPKLVKKLFGIGGEIAYKNLKRNKKKYRTTVVSIVVSVSIFIAMSCFMNYAFKTSSIYYTEKEYNLTVYERGDERSYDKLEQASKVEGIEKYSLQRIVRLDIPLKKFKQTQKAKEMFYGSEELKNESLELTIELVSLGKEEYARYIKELGLSYEKVKDKVILIDDYMTYVTDENGKGVYQKFDTMEYKAGDKIQAKYTNRGKEINKTVEFEIAKKTDKRPMGFESTYSSNGFWIVSDEWIETVMQGNYSRASLYIKCDNANQVEDNIKAISQNLSINNYDEAVRQENAMWLVIAIFLYGFIAVISLIGITNIFNTITTNMNLRSKEFANLKSIGMTKKEFNRMIRLESIFYGTKSLLIGIPIGIGLSYLIYKAFAESAEMGFLFPTSGVIISIIAVFVLILGIMKYSLNKINKQNIIETIRKDNI